MNSHAGGTGQPPTQPPRSLPLESRGGHVPVQPSSALMTLSAVIRQ